MSVEVSLDAPYGRYYKDGQPTSERWLLFLMNGAVPQTPEEVKARVDLNSFTDLFNKAVGISGTSMSAGSCVRDVGSTVMTIKGVATGAGADATLYKNGVYTVAPNSFVLPRKVFRVDGKTHWLACNRALVNLAHSGSDGYSGATQLRSLASDPNTTDFQYEYDNAVTIASVYWFGGGANSVTAISTLAILYYDEATTSWKTAQSYALTNANNSSGVTFAITTPFTAKKIIARVTSLDLAPYAISIKLYGTSATNPATGLGDVVVPTWGILVPEYVVNFGQSSVSVNWLQSQVQGKTNYIPAIIDTAGYNDGSRIELNADYTFKRYTYALGGIKS